MKTRKLILVAVSALVSLWSAHSGAQTKPLPDLCAVAPGAQPSLPARLLTGMGTTNMPVTTKSDEARAFFNQGMSQVHSFWFTESERSFLQALTLDPDFAMAYWGIAVSAAGDYRPAFQLMRNPNEGGRRGAAPESTEIQRTTNGAAIDGEIRAREYVEKAMALRDKVTERERLYIESQWARRDPAHGGDAKKKDAAYIEGLRKLGAAYPDDIEAVLILGLATLNGFDPVTKEPRAGTTEALALLEGVVAKDDNQFGAHHYLIHGWEGSKTPERAWHACQRYPELVPNIPHALHMPGHIYAQSDRIDDAVAAFGAASENELGYLAADVLYANGHHGHNEHFLIQALNLDGRFRDSMDHVKHLLSYKETPREREGLNQRSVYRQGLFALIKTLTRFERWDLVLDGTTIPVYDKPEQNGWRHWATGLALARRGEIENARQALSDLEKDYDAAKGNREPLGIAVAELKGTIESLAGNPGKGYAHFREAADREAAQLYTEPPAYPRPVVEALGSVALALKDYATAEKAYREALEREPGGGRAYFGLAGALSGLGRVDEAQKMIARGTAAWDKADADLPQMQKLVPTAASAKGN